MIGGMVAIEEQIPGRATVGQRWLARGTILAAAASIAVPLLAIGFQASLAAIIVGVVGLAVIGASVWWALTHKGIVRWLAVVLAVLAAAAVSVSRKPGGADETMGAHRTAAKDGT